MFGTSIPSAVYNFSIAFIPAIFGIICHEIAHGWVAYKQGDPTAKMLGRLTFNPIKHIDPMGLAMFVLTALAGPFVIGWAKPVPVNPRFFKMPRQGMVFVAFAGPLTNFLVAIFFAIILRIVVEGIQPADDNAFFNFLIMSATAGIWINCTLAWFNLMPVPPLDGSHIVAGVLPAPLAQAYESLGRYGMFIIIALLYFGLFARIIRPLVQDSVKLIMNIVTFF